MPELYAEAAVRHFCAAECLAKSKCFDNAGYLIGYAVECAIKHAVENTRPAAGAPHLHLPSLVEKAKKALHGRRKHSVFTILEKPNFMSGWKVELRYASDNTIGESQYGDWRADASRAISAAGLRQRL